MLEMRDARATGLRNEINIFTRRKAGTDTENGWRNLVRRSSTSEGGSEPRRMQLARGFRKGLRRSGYCASARTALAKACQGCDELTGTLSRLSSSSAVPPIA